MVFLTLAGCQTEGTLLTEHPANQSNKTAITQINRDIQTTSGLILLAEAELALGNADTALSLYIRASHHTNNVDVSERAAFLVRQPVADQ